MKNIYILNDKKVKHAKNIEVIKIEYIDTNIDINQYDTIIFSSKNGVKAINNITKNWTTKDIYSIGKATTKEIKSFGKDIKYEAKKNYGNEFANEIINQLKDKKVLYPRAKEVLSNLVNILKENNIVIEEKIVYQTVCNQIEISKKPPKNSIIIFSSPSTYKCFEKNFDWDDSYRAIAIGKVTAKYLPNNIKCIVSNIQTIEGCVNIAIEL
jgi:uroporphyrinogen-III synthase